MLISVISFDLVFIIFHCNKVSRNNDSVFDHMSVIFSAEKFNPCMRRIIVNFPSRTMARAVIPLA